MLIPVSELSFFWSVRATGVLHVGAHEAEEAAEYDKAGWGPVTWIEALPDKVEVLRARFMNTPQHQVVGALVWDVDGEPIRLWRANFSQASSVLKLGSHTSHYPEIQVVESILLRSSRLDSLVPASEIKIDFLNLDIQGAELHALRGLGKRLADIRWIYCEVNVEEVYQQNPLITDVDQFLEGSGFRRVDLEMTSSGWGDALYVRKDCCPPFPGLRRFLRHSMRRARKTLSSALRRG